LRILVLAPLSVARSGLPLCGERIGVAGKIPCSFQGRKLIVGGAFQTALLGAFHPL
jgi:hypothetical protein